MDFFVIRTFFFAISFFTFLNTAKILKIPLHFPWLILFLISFLGWFFWETIYKKNFNSPSIMAGFFLFNIYTDIFGNAFDFYTKINWFDRLTHFIGGTTAGIFSFFILIYFNEKYHWNLSFRAIIIIFSSLALSFLVFYEFWEYFAYSILNYKLIIIGETDTIDDLFFGFLGILNAALISRLFLKKYYSFAKGMDSKIK